MSNGSREIVLDTETTGLDPRQGHRIVEIGALEMIGGVLTGKKFHHYINPERDMPAEAYRVHGLSSEFLETKPVFKEIAQEFNQFIDGAKLVIHNAPFDMKFLNYELQLLDYNILPMELAIDTLIIAKRKFPGSRVSLDALCRRFKVDNSDRAYHGALKDALLLADVYVELMGGRQSSFSLSNYQTNKTAKQWQDSVEPSCGNKVVIQPDITELEAHAQLLKKIFPEAK